MAQRCREFQRKRQEKYSRPRPLCSFEGEGHDVRKHLISIHDHIIKEDDQKTAAGRSVRLDLTLVNLKHVQGEDRRLAYEQICKNKLSSSGRRVAGCAVAGVHTVPL